MRYFTHQLVLISLAAHLLIVPSFASNPAPWANPEKVEGRYDYKRSFKKPFFLPNTNTIPHFNVMGDVIPSNDYMRLAPSVRSQKGAIWSQLPTDYEFWTVDLKFMISGRGRIGGDGLAFWFVREPNILGSVYGSKDNWDGLGIILDTYDNDNQRNNPVIMGILNDGSISYAHDLDGEGQHIGQCVRHYRNPSVPSALKITYFEHKITVSIDTAEQGRAYTTCFEIADVTLPSGYYFGVSAATGGLADDHDIYSFEVAQLFPEGSDLAAEKAPTEEQQKNFEQVQSKVQEFRDKQEQQNEPFDNRGGSDDLDAVLAKLDTVVAIQLELQSKIQTLQMAAPATGGGTPLSQPIISTLSDSQSKMMLKMNEIDNNVRKVQSDLISLQDKVNQQQRQSNGNDPRLINLEAKMSALENSISSQTRSIQHISSTLGVIQTNTLPRANAIKDDSSEGLFDSPMVIFFVIEHVLAIVGVGIYVFLNSKERTNSAKKFS